MLERLQQLLLGSSEATRPVARLELPLKLDHFITPASLARMRAAAVLVPVLDHAAGATILLTRRAETLRDHFATLDYPGLGTP